MGSWINAFRRDPYEAVALLNWPFFGQVNLGSSAPWKEILRPGIDGRAVTSTSTYILACSAAVPKVDWNEPQVRLSVRYRTEDRLRQGTP